MIFQQMNRWLNLVLLSLTVAPQHAMSGSLPGRVGGACEYKETLGQGTITSVESATQQSITLVRFDFEALPQTHPQRTVEGQLVLSGEQSLQKWLELHQIREGAKIPIKRLDIIKGTCSPIIYELVR